MGESGIKYALGGRKWERKGRLLQISHQKVDMLIGEYTHTLDDKNRLTLPKKFKEELGKKLVLTRGLDNCIYLYSQKEWEVLYQKLKDLPFTDQDSRAFMRFMFSGAAEVEVDKSGRILIPESLRKFAGLKNKVVLAGVSDKVEIWDEKRWRSYTEKIEKSGDKLAQKLADLGF